MNVSGNYSAFQKIPLFRSYTEDELYSLTSRASIKTYRKNTIVIMEKDDSQSIYFILEGTVRVFCENSRGKVITLNELKPGDYFGELAGFSNNCRTASVITKQPSKLIALPSKEFENFYKKHSEINQAITIKYANQISTLSKHLKAIALKDIQDRVMWALNSYSIIDEDDTKISTVTHKELADLIGSSRESVSRAIHELKSSGQIISKNKAIHLVNHNINQR